ncbi:MAG: RNA polymerase sigma factor [Mucilaginibacter sp.]
MSANSLQMTDNELLSLLKKGDEAAFKELYNRYWDKLFVTAFHRLGDELEAEEVVQDIFVSIWQRRNVLELTYSLATYLSVAVKYKVITKLAGFAKQKARDASIAAESAEGVESTSQWLSEKELRRQIEECINKLPEKCRIVFQMSREQNLSNKQIAEKLGVSEKTVEGHITKAIHTLKNSLNISLPLLFFLLKK